MKKLAVIFVIGIILLMTVGIVFANSELSRDLKDSIEKALEARGKKVKNITDLGEGFYEIDVGEEKPVFAITYSDKMFRKTSEKITYSQTFLNFGFNGEMNESGFLKSSTGVEGDLEKGYVMMRRGSITGISTSLDVISPSNSGQIEIIIYKNGEAIGFGNTVDAVSSGTKRDYDIQSRDTVIFESGDVISIYVKAQGDIVWKDVITMIEITTVN